MAIANPVSFFLMLIFLGLWFAVFECEVGGKPMYYQTEETRLKRELARQEHKDNLMNTEVFSFLGQKIEDRCSKEENVHKEVCIKVRNNDGVYKLE